jgi:serine/threonine-protein phosphatase 2B catalytic subunit
MTYVLLKDPLNDRIAKDVPLPIQRRLPYGYAFINGKTPNWKGMIEAFLKDGLLNHEDAIQIIQKAKALFNMEENITKIDGTVVVVGDIHGNFYDLCKIFQMGGPPPDNGYVFVGDYVDRGYYSCEVVLLLYALKICFPSKIILLRGNHEARERKGELNLKVECLRKYNNQVYDCFINSFDYLPIACTINQSFLALHGGLSPKVHSFEDLQKLERRQEPVDAISDILWSDPVNNENGYIFPSFTPNESRGRGYLYGLKAIQNMFDGTSLLSLIRGHEPQINGFKMFNWCGEKAFPPLISLFSSPNYCGIPNKGAIIKIAQKKFQVHQFNACPKPFMLPNAMDGITWAMPFLVKKTLEFVKALKISDSKFVEDSKVLSRFSLIKCKILVVTVLARMLANIRQRKRSNLKKMDTIDAKKLFVREDLNLTIRFKVKLCKTF